MLKIILLVLFTLLLSACSSGPASLPMKDNDLNFQIRKEKDIETWGRKFVFESAKKARGYVLERRLSMQRLYQLTSEPYFGTPEEVDCQDNIDTDGEFESIKNGEALLLRLLSNKNYALGDCLKENNDLRAYYIFYLCDNKVYEYRIYKNLLDSKIPSIDELACEKK